jgi:hypothetical protein
MRKRERIDHWMIAGNWPRADHWWAVGLCLLLTACQPQARRALVLDLALSDPALLEGTAGPWQSAGYAVEYRRFYPHLTRSDLSRYHVLLLLLGRGPEVPSDALTAGDLAVLNEWVRGGRAAVLGYAGDGEGSLDRWTVNRWLASQGAGIAIGARVLEDSTAQVHIPRAQPWAEGRPVGDNPLGSVYDSFPLDRNHVLSVRRRGQVLAAVRLPPSTIQSAALPSGAPIAAASRLGDGLVVVISRYALGALAPQSRPSTMPLLQLAALEGTHHFLTALARWTRHPAEWAHVPPGGHRVPLSLTGAPLPVEPQPARNGAPVGAPTVELAQSINRETVRGRSEIPSWIRQVGMRALWTPLLSSEQGHEMVRSSTSLDSLIGSLDAAGLNLLAGDAHPETIGDSLHHHWADREAVRRAWSEVVRRIQPTSVAWIPAFDFAGYRSPRAWTDSSRGSRGEALGTPCALDSLLWDGVVAPAYTALARLASQARQLVPALALDLSGPRKGGWRGYSMGQEFCDAAWRQALTRIGQRGVLDTIPLPDRYRTLREAGLLALYFGALEDLVADRARTLRDRALRESGGLYFAFRLSQAPGDWFTLGLCRGFALADRPLLFFTPEVETRELLAAYRARRLNAVHAVELPLALVRQSTLSGLKRVAFGENEGFWFSMDEGGSARTRSTGRWPSDSVALLLRRIGR